MLEVICYIVDYIWGNAFDDYFGDNQDILFFYTNYNLIIHNGKNLSTIYATNENTISCTEPHKILEHFSKTKILFIDCKNKDFNLILQLHQHILNLLAQNGEDKHSNGVQ